MCMSVEYEVYVCLCICVCVCVHNLWVSARFSVYTYVFVYIGVSMNFVNLCVHVCIGLFMYMCVSVEGY